jgi:hypothetical protein
LWLKDEPGFAPPTCPHENFLPRDTPMRFQASYQSDGENLRLKASGRMNRMMSEIQGAAVCCVKPRRVIPGSPLTRRPGMTVVVMQ